LKDLEEGELLTTLNGFLADNAEGKLSTIELIKREPYFVRALDIVERLLEAARQNSSCIVDSDLVLALGLIEATGEYADHAARGSRFRSRIGMIYSKISSHERHFLCPNKPFFSGLFEKFRN
jgi:hypothetical protein